MGIKAIGEGMVLPRTLLLVAKRITLGVSVLSVTEPRKLPKVPRAPKASRENLHRALRLGVNAPLHL